MNNVQLIGRLTRDIDLRKTPQGDSVGRFTLAVDRNYKNKQGEYDADFINCTIWRGAADILARYAQKGTLKSTQNDDKSKKVDEILRQITQSRCGYSQIVHKFRETPLTNSKQASIMTGITGSLFFCGMLTETGKSERSG